MAKKAKKVLPKTFSLERYLTKINKEEIRSDQDVQRLSGQFTPAMINELIVTVLTDDYIPEIILGDEIGSKQTWMVDGVQRSSSLIKFRFENYKITSSIEDSIIEYDKQVLENGQAKRDGNDNIVWETVEFDIKGKTYSDLPEELKNIFNDYQIKTVIHQNCTMKQISKLIRRYNNHTGMNAVQKAFTYIDGFARDIRGLVEHRFFKDCGTFTESEKIKGTYNRVICESIMAMFHLDKWKNSPKSIFSYLNKEGSDEEFEVFRECLNRLESLIEKKDELFNSKNAFIWITLFYKFTSIGLPDDKFVDFMNSFRATLRNEKLPGLDNLCFDEYDKNKGTKDKKVVSSKIDALEILMMGFLDVSKEMIIQELAEITIDEFVCINVNSEISTDDVEQYKEVLDDLTLNVDNSSKLLDVKNRASLVSMVAYSFENDIDLDNWIVDYFDRNKSYITDQKKNYFHMVQDLKQYTSNKERLSA